MAKLYTAEEVIADIRDRLRGTTQTALAAEIGVSLSHLNDVLFGRRYISDHVANALGYQREVIFRKSAA